MKNSLIKIIKFFLKNNNNYDIERKSVKEGIKSFNKREGISYSSILCRNIHRIEKGLSTPCRKEVFAGDYIEETIIAYKNQVEKSNDKARLKWAYDVLIEFFKVVKHSGQITEAYTLFKEIDFQPDNNIGKLFTFPYSELPVSNITLEAFEALCKQRKSVRWYKNERAPKEKVKKAVQTALLSPSACNRQAFRFEYIDAPEQVSIIKNLPPGIKNSEETIQSMAFLIGDLSAYFDERDRHLIYIDGGIFATTFMLGLTLSGLASCPVHWPDIKEKELKLAKYLNLKPYERCIMCFSIGIPFDESPVLCSQRKDIETVWGENNVYID